MSGWWAARATTPTASGTPPTRSANSPAAASTRCNPTLPASSWPTRSRTCTMWANLTGIGNALDNIVMGGTGAQTLDGGAGDDVLMGGRRRRPVHHFRRQRQRRHHRLPSRDGPDPAARLCAVQSGRGACGHDPGGRRHHPCPRQRRAAGAAQHPGRQLRRGGFPAAGRSRASRHAPDLRRRVHPFQRLGRRLGQAPGRPASASTSRTARCRPTRRPSTIPTARFR